MSPFQKFLQTQCILNIQYEMLITHSNENQFSLENSKAFLLGESNFQAIRQVSTPSSFGCKSVLKVTLFININVYKLYTYMFYFGIEILLPLSFIRFMNSRITFTQDFPGKIKIQSASRRNRVEYLRIRDETSEGNETWQTEMEILQLFVLLFLWCKTKCSISTTFGQILCKHVNA